MKNTWIELDLSVLTGNLRSMQSALGAGTEIILVVKSNAYGHGMELVARHARECGVKWFAVVRVDEALVLRKLLPDAQIILLGVIDPAEVAVAIERNLIPVIVSEKHAMSLMSSPALAGPDAAARSLRCHAKVDTGMGRLGFAWEQAGQVVPGLACRPGLDICGICTHFASSGSDDRNFADLQAERFAKVVAECEAGGLTIPFKHMSNSGAILRDSAWDMDAVRGGILLYGYGQGPPGQTRDSRGIRTEPFLQWKTRVVQVKKVPAGFPVSYDSTYVTNRETHVATIDAGYADGYSRLLSNSGFVVAGGRRRPVIGRVTMNLFTVDLGPVTKVTEGDEVVLVGSQGAESVWADEIAGWCNTIFYEVLTSIRTEVRRVVKK